MLAIIVVLIVVIIVLGTMLQDARKESRFWEKETNWQREANLEKTDELWKLRCRIVDLEQPRDKHGRFARKFRKR